MKTKYTIYHDREFDAEPGGSGTETLKTFKHERDAIAFYDNPKNTRGLIGNIYMIREDPDGRVFQWDDFSRTWMM